MKSAFASILIVSSVLVQFPAQAEIAQNQAMEIALRLTSQNLRLPRSRLALGFITGDKYQYMIRVREVLPSYSQFGETAIRACEVIVQSPQVAWVTHCDPVRLRCIDDVYECQSWQ